MLDPNKAYISLSKTAGALLKQIGASRDAASGDDIKKQILGAFNAGDITVLENSKEMHFLAEATINGVHCYLLCVTQAGSPSGRQEFTTGIKGVMLPGDARELLRINKGLAPIGRTLAANRWKDKHDG